MQFKTKLNGLFGYKKLFRFDLMGFQKNLKIRNMSRDCKGLQLISKYLPWIPEIIKQNFKIFQGISRDLNRLK